MRTIKFRRAHFFDKEKTNFSHFTYWGVKMDIFEFVSPSTHSSALYCIDCQFPGLLDIHGNEIYEGDVVSMIDEYYIGDFRHKGFIGRVEYNDGSYEVIGENEFDTFCLSVNDINSFGFKVIGNIYENPDLLE